MIKTFFGLTLLLGVFLAGWFHVHDRVHRIADATRPETVFLKKKTSQGSIHGITVSGSGSISGSAEIQLILNGTVYQRKKFTGEFSVEMSGDWYADEAELRYIPSGVSGGNVELKYNFRS